MGSWQWECYHFERTAGSFSQLQVAHLNRVISSQPFFKSIYPVGFANCSSSSINNVQATSVSQHQLIFHFSQQTVPLQLQARTIHSSKYLVLSTNTPTAPANLTTLYNQKLPVLTTTRSHVSPPDELFVHGGSENKRDEGKRKNKKRTGRQP